MFFGLHCKLLTLIALKIITQPILALLDADYLRFVLEYSLFFQALAISKGSLQLVQLSSLVQFGSLILDILPNLMFVHQIKALIF